MRRYAAWRGLLLGWIILLLLPAAARAHGDDPAAVRAAGSEPFLLEFLRLPAGEISLSSSLKLLSARAGRDLAGRSAADDSAERVIDSLSRRVLAYTIGTKDPRRAVAALNRILFEEEGFVYDAAPGNPDNYLLDRVLARKRGNCLGLTAVYLVLGERLGIPLSGVYVPSHCFVRYEANGARINVETGEKGADLADDWYLRRFRLHEGRPYLRSLSQREMLGVYLKSLGAAYSRKGREDDALRLYRDAARLHPGLPDAYFNAGVSYQKLGRMEDAVAQYRLALGLDPDMARARGNLAAAYCNCGRMEDGIREYRKALEAEPGNVTARAGLAKAHFARGEYREAIANCDRAMEAGCRFDPSMLATLEPYRIPPEMPLP